MVWGRGEDAFVHGDDGEGLLAENLDVALEVAFGLLAAGPGQGGGGGDRRFGSRVCRIVALLKAQSDGFLVGEVAERGESAERGDQGRQTAHEEERPERVSLSIPPRRDTGDGRLRVGATGESVEFGGDSAQPADGAHCSSEFDVWCPQAGD